MIKAPRGTKDILPPESNKWSQVEALLRRLSNMYNFQEIRTPIFEHTELFTRTVGESTDIVQKEMYTFEDKGGRSLTLRPEGTAPVVRAFLEHGLDGGALPVKFFYLGPMFRYEKPQAGRYREFMQFGVEILGSPSPFSDVEVIQIGVRIAEELGLIGTTLFINTIGCPLCRKEYREDLVKFLSERVSDLCPDCQSRLETNPLRVLDCKNPSCRKVTAQAPQMHEYLCAECQEHWDMLRSILTSMGMEYKVDPTLVRGLDYYTRTVFEIKWPPLGAQDTIVGGGRYDGLVEELGGKPTPGVGFALGLERLLLASDKGEKRIDASPSVDCFVVIATGDDEAVSREISLWGFELLDNLRSLGVSCDFDPLMRSVKAQMKQANRVDARYVVILGEEEFRDSKVSVRSMRDGWQKEVALDQVLGFVKGEISGGTN
ncbi:MAG: histidine--tRNA ligase [Firmicutes bacterium]|jgi:histidyl-tRNA synthetase|nr:histidine--tRNA ligase [Candidatus Fermentithermobacillaceae bacterium]